MKLQLRTDLLWATIVLGTALVAQMAPAQNSSEPVVTLDSGPIVQLCANCSPRELRLAVTAKPALRIKKSKTGQEDPGVIEVSFGNVRDSSLVSEFVPRWELSKCGIPQALIIGVGEKIRKAGNYDLVLSPQPKTSPGAPRLKVQIVHAASKLELPEKLLVDRTEYWPFHTTTDKMRFDVREASAVSEVIDVGLQSRPSTLGSDMVTGQLVIDVRPPGTTPQPSGTPPKPFIAAGQTRELNYDLSGSFPLGAVAGSVRFFAPELTDPATLNFEVHSKLTKLYMLFAIVLGLWMSWYLKVYLHNRIELAEAISKAASLLDRVQADWNSHRDHLFRDALTARIKPLSDAIKDRDAAAIALAITPLDEAWRGALQDYAARSQTARAELDELRKLTDSAWILPPTALAVLAQAKQAPAGEIDISDIQGHLAQNDAVSASDAVVQLRQRLAEQLRQCGINWHNDAMQFLRQLAEARAGIPARIAAQLREAQGKSTQQLNRMNPEQLVAGPTTAIMIQFLRDFEGEYRVAGELVRELGLRLGEEWTEFRKVLDLSAEEVAANVQLARLKTKLDEFANGLGQAVSEPAVALEELQGALGELQEAWRAAIVQQADALPQPPPNLNNLLQHQDFLGAAELIAAARTAAQENVALAEVVQQQQSAPSWPELAGLFPTSALSVISSLPQLVAIPSALSGLHFQSLKKVKAGKRIQTFVMAVLMILYSYTIYSRTYGGTWSDISTIFFAAFAIDVAVDAMFSKIIPKTA